MKPFLSITCASLLLIVGCGASQNPVTSLLEVGEIRGSAEIQVSYNETLQPSNITVALDSGSLQTVTDSNGNWMFDSIPVGTHELSVSKNGFGEERLYNIQVAPGSITFAGQAILCPEPTQHLHIDSLRLLDSTPPLPLNAQWQVFFTHDTGAEGIAVFLDSTPNVAPTDEHIFSEVDGGNLGQGNSYSNLFSFLLSLTQHGYRSGSTLYLSACIFNGLLGGYGVGSYYDPAADQERVVAAGPKSNVVLFVVP
jgi:hypothetical protein